MEIILDFDILGHNCHGSPFVTRVMTRALSSDFVLVIIMKMTAMTSSCDRFSFQSNLEMHIWNAYTSDI